ncbi:MAG: HAD family hydrolase [Jatrophihabitantaceae bacterium]
MIRAVFLDVDDTLVDYDPAARAAFAAALGDNTSYDAWLTLDHYARWVAGEFDGFQAFRDSRMHDFLALLGRAADLDRAAELERRRFDSLADHYALFDDVLPLLDVLRRRGIRLGLITNNESVHQRDKLARVGLDSRVDAIVISDEVGVAKPDRAIFDHALDLVGVAAEEAMHIGDNLIADAQGAHAAGLHAVWLDRRGRYDGRPLDCAVVRGLAEVPALLD